MKLMLAAALALSPPSAGSDEDILATAASNGSFDTLVSLVVAAGLDDALQGHGHFTVFAPTDEAFAKVPAETLRSLRLPENRERLAEILEYHVVGSVISVPERAPEHRVTRATTLQGADVRFRREGAAVFVNDAEIVGRNVECSNGVVQAIDRVLLPPADAPTLVGIARRDGRFGTLLAAVEAAGLADALAEADELTILAPTDEAFAALPEGTLEELLRPENQKTLARILKDHVLPGRLDARALAARDSASALSGSKLPVAIRAGSLEIAGARVVQNDIEAEGGLIHVLDRVIVLGTGDDAGDAASEVVEIRATWRDHVVRDGVRAERIVITCLGGGSVDLTGIEAREVVTRISGGGRVKLSGRTHAHEATVSGGAVLAARDLVAETTDLGVNGGGDATVNATRALAFRASSGATVRYVDTGAKVEQDAARYAVIEVLER